MDYCPDCKMEIRFRMMNGRRVPFGCVCNRISYGDIPHGEQGHWKTNCPKCRARIYFLRHNGGCVWLDELGHPWPEHGCFADNKKRNGINDAFPGKHIVEIGWMGFLYNITDLGQRCIDVRTTGGIVELYVAKGFWSVDPPVKARALIGLGKDRRSLHLVTGETFDCWPVQYFKCANCDKVYFQQNAHKEICQGTKDED